MTRAKRMKPVQNLFDDTERRLAMGLATIERKVADAETKLQELERYAATTRSSSSSAPAAASVQRTCAITRLSWRGCPRRFASSRRS